MSREELGALLRLLVDSGKLTAAQAAAIVRKFDAGELDAADLPVPLAETPGGLTHTEQAAAIFVLVGLLALFAKRSSLALLRQASSSAASIKPVITLAIRQRLRDQLRAEHEQNIASITKEMANGGSVQEWQAAMIAERRSYAAEMMTAGAGRALTAEEVVMLGDVSISQQAFLTRFAAEVSAKRALGEQPSEAALVNRARQYQGDGWAAWFRGNENSQSGDGNIVYYDAVDDNATCGPCIEAQNSSPYLVGQGPMPGDVCRGGGYCRCKRRVVFDMTVWRQLTGVTP